MSSKSDEDYGLSTVHETGEIEAPELSYRPLDPQGYSPLIGLIGCGGITEQHLAAYKNAGYRVAMLCDLDLSRAEKRRAKFFPDAVITSDYRQVVSRPDIEVLDITTHPEERVPILEAAIDSGKHILSQKPFVTDLEVGERLVRRAKEKGIRLAVNQNGRWAPHFSYLRQAVERGLIGEVAKVEMAVRWDHNWVADTVFNDIHHLVLYDFAIHWFDMATVLFGDRRARKVFASVERSSSQKAKPPLLAQAVVEWEGGQANLSFDGDCPYGQEDRTTVIGSEGTISSLGPSLQEQTVQLFLKEGHCTPRLEGQWFPDGFHGAMAELLSAIHENREPIHSAAGNLRSLELCFASLASADRGEPEVPGEVRRIG